MLKQLLSLAAVAAISMSANADVNIFSSFGSGGWNSTYDADSKTVTYDDAWTGCGWWLDGADYSDYESIVIKFAEPLTGYAQIVCQYTENDEDGNNSASAGASEGATQIEYTFDNDRKSSIVQIYLQCGETIRSIVLEDAYLTETSNSTEKVLFEGEQALGWYPGYEIDKTKIISAGAGSKLVAEVQWGDSADGWSVKLGISWTGSTLPSFAELDGFSTQWSTLWLSNSTWTYTFTDEDITALTNDGDSNLHLCSEESTILKKLTLVKPESAAVNSIAVDNENAPVEYFNLQGVRVANPQNGLYIRRQGNKATKVILK